MLTVHVEPTEDSFSFDLMFRTVNINQFGGLAKILCKSQNISTYYKTLSKVYLFRKVDSDLPYFQQLHGNFIFPPCLCYNWIFFQVVFCGIFFEDFLEVG